MCARSVLIFHHQVTPQQPSSHPEWRDLFDQNSATVQQQFLNMRHLGRRIGYFINDVRKGRVQFAFCAIHNDHIHTKTRTTLWKSFTRKIGEKQRCQTRRILPHPRKTHWLRVAVTSMHSSGCTFTGVGCARGRC